MELNAKTLKNYLNIIYKNIKPDEIKRLCDQIKTLFPHTSKQDTHKELWDEKDFFLITYADSVKQKKKIILKV